LEIEIINRESGHLEQFPLTFDSKDRAEVRLELAPGASALQVVLREGNTVYTAIEAAAQPGERVSFEFLRDSQGAVRPICRSLKYLTLPLEKPSEPLLLRPHQGQELDLAILVDGTCLHPAGDQAKGLDYLLSPSMTEAWETQITALGQFVQTAAGRYSSVRVTALAFGDEPMEGVVSRDLMPDYLIFPRDPKHRIFAQAKPEEIAALTGEQLRKLESTSGGDFVDALADGLNACLNLPWRQLARRLVLVFGQSPGYSLLEPFESPASYNPRELCIEEEVTKLHRKQIEVATVFHHPWKFEDQYMLARPKLIEASQRQYAMLANLPSWAIRSGSEPALRTLAESWLSPPACLARGACSGVLVTD
jgi:hypothetical protein